MGGFTCCVPGCYNNSTRQKGLGFFVFPKENSFRQEWIRRIDRAGQSGRFSKFVPTAGHIVCGAHFEGGKKTYMVRIPAILPLKQQKVAKRRSLTRIQPTQLNNSALPANQQEPDTATADEADTACCSTGDSCPTQAEFDPRSDHSYSFHKKARTSCPGRSPIRSM
ncbi:unnamed protein product [Ixodes persulcatus]